MQDETPQVGLSAVRNTMYSEYLHYHRNKKSHTRSLFLFLILEIIVGAIMIGTAIHLG